MFLLISAVLPGSLVKEQSLLIATVGARLVSATANFCINRSVVFKGNETLGRSILKYAALAICILAANYGLMYLLNLKLGMNRALAKVIVEAALYAVSFTVQGRVVYRKGHSEAK